MKNKISQKNMVLAHLQKFGSIEPMTSLRDYGCYRLSDVIFRLRREGHHIKTDLIEGTSRITGEPNCYALYTLIEQ